MTYDESHAEVLRWEIYINNSRMARSSVPYTEHNHVVSGVCYKEPFTSHLQYVFY